MLCEYVWCYTWSFACLYIITLTFEIWFFGWWYHVTAKFHILYLKLHAIFTNLKFEVLGCWGVEIWFVYFKILDVIFWNLKFWNVTCWIVDSLTFGMSDIGMRDCYDLKFDLLKLIIKDVETLLIWKLRLHVLRF